MEPVLTDGANPAGQSDTPLADETATDRFGRFLAPLMAGGDLVCLHGDLGAGKTALARAIIRTLARNPALEVPSPTFNLVQVYDDTTPPVRHFDLYRLTGEGDVLDLGWDDALEGEALILVEWPDRLGSLALSDRLDIYLRHGAAGGRIARLEPHGQWWKRLSS